MREAYYNPRKAEKHIHVQFLKENQIFAYQNVVSIATTTKCPNAYMTMAMYMCMGAALQYKGVH